ncbi:MAG: LCP family protein [Actinomycetota bacterium]|nr:LCP family protein [Actinomycetota bacterium]
MSTDGAGASPVGARTRRLSALRRQRRRSIIHTALALIPGAGLLGTRYRRLGYVMLALLVAMVLGTTFFVLAKGAVSAALNVAVRPDALLTVAGLAAVGALVWIFSIILTHRGTAPKRADPQTRLGLRLFTAFICLLVALPMAQVVRYSLIQRDVVSTVFTGQGMKSLTPSAQVTASPDAQAVDPWEGVERVNLLLIGSDAGDDRIGVRTDSMVEASINPATGDAVLISIPRSLERAPFPASNPLHAMYPDGYYCPNAKPGDECLINAVWALAEENKTLFKNNPNPGLTTIRDVIGEVTGLHVDYSTVIDLAGFQSLVQAMGGVTVNVTERLPIEGYHTSNGGIAGVEGYIEPGRQTLDGYHALWYARSRLLSDDFSRMRRQRCLIGALIDQVNPVTMLSKYPDLANVAKNNVSTDLQVSQLPAWVDLVQRVQKGSITSLTFTTDNISPANPNFAKIRQMVQNAIQAPAATTGVSPTTSAPASPIPTPTTTPTTTSKAPETTSPTTTPTVSGGAVDVRTAC